MLKSIDRNPALCEAIQAFLKSTQFLKRLKRLFGVLHVNGLGLELGLGLQLGLVLALVLGAGPVSNFITTDLSAKSVYIKTPRQLT